MEITENEVDLGRLPVPVHALEDGGPYFDASVVIARDPESGVRNASIQRFMVAGPDTLHINIDAGRHLGLYLEKAAERGETLPITINVGVGPGLHFAAATPSEAAPPDTDELGIAGEFHGAPLELVPGYLGSKVGFDATRPWPHTPEFDRGADRDISLDGYDIVMPDGDRVAPVAPATATGDGGDFSGNTGGAAM